MTRQLLLLCLLAGCDDSGQGLPELPDITSAPDLALTFPEVDAAMPCVVDVDCPGASVCFEGRCVELPDLAVVGCVSDQQCKGMRVCVNGFCVDPAPADLAVELPIDASTPMDSSARADGFIGAADLVELGDLVPPCGYQTHSLCRFADGGAQWCVWQRHVWRNGMCVDPGNVQVWPNDCESEPDAGGIVVRLPTDAGCAYQPE